MSNLWEDIEPYVQVLVKNSDFELLDKVREGTDDTDGDWKPRGKHARKSLPAATSTSAASASSSLQSSNLSSSADASSTEPSYLSASSLSDSDFSSQAADEMASSVDRDVFSPPPLQIDYAEEDDEGQGHQEISENMEVESSEVRRGVPPEDAAEAARGVSPNRRSPMEALRRNHARQEKVDELKLRYIAGKAAGRDILDRKGNVLIKRGDVLTADNIALAEENGKLVELIVHMVIDDLGD